MMATFPAEDAPPVRAVLPAREEDEAGREEGCGRHALISWDRDSDSSAVLACVLGPIYPHPSIDRGKVPIP
jgi:hypothetical protein